MKNLILAFGLIAMLGIVGCATPEESGPEPTTPATTGDDGYSGMEFEPVVFANEAGEPICPVMGGVVADPSALSHADHDGKRYYFCCDGCPQAFHADPEKFADGRALGHDHDDHDGHDH